MSLAEGRRDQLNRAASWFVVYLCAAARLGGASSNRNAARFDQKSRARISSRLRSARGRRQRSFSADNKSKKRRSRCSQNCKKLWLQRPKRIGRQSAFAMAVSARNSRTRRSAGGVLRSRRQTRLALSIVTRLRRGYGQADA